MGVHVVVDGSNLATEGRTLPSLRQLDEAVRAYMEEFPGDSVTVVVDATFGHRIDPSEVPAFDEAVENNELVSPPAGAIGRGDAFVLQIAHKANARVLSNDSFQEFHGSYDWLFDEGRLMGGKPVPHVGWVFVLRAPVRGPASRRAVRDSRKRPSTASLPSLPPLPAVPATPPPGRAPRRERGGRGVTTAAPGLVPEPVALAEAKAEPLVAVDAGAAAGGPRPEPTGRRSKGPAMLNEALPFLEFIPEHPVGSTVTGTVESFSSHGAYVRVGELSCYVPLRYLATPAPRAAREVLRIGEDRTFVVVAFDATRRGIDVALPGFGPAGLVEQAPGVLDEATDLVEATAGQSTTATAPSTAVPRRRGRRRPATVGVLDEEPLAVDELDAVVSSAVLLPDPDAPAAPEAPPAPSRRRTGRSTGVTPVEPAPTEAVPASVATPEATPVVEVAPAAEPTSPAARPSRGRRPAALPAAEVAAILDPPPLPPVPTPARRTRKAAATTTAPAAEAATPAPAPARKATARKAAAAVEIAPSLPPVPAPPEAPRARKAATKAAPAKKAAKAPTAAKVTAPAKAPAAKKAAKAPATAKQPTTKQAAPTKAAAKKATPAKKAAPRKATPAAGA